MLFGAQECKNDTAEPQGVRTTGPCHNNRQKLQLVLENLREKRACRGASKKQQPVADLSLVEMAEASAKATGSLS